MMDEWRLLAEYPDPLSAEAAAGLLRSEFVPVRVVSDEPVPGLMNGCSLMVPKAMLARAQAIFSLAPMSDEEWSQYVADVLAAEEADPKDESK
jgi:hypothetical protein